MICCDVFYYVISGSLCHFVSHTTVISCAMLRFIKTALFLLIFHRIFPIICYKINSIYTFPTCYLSLLYHFREKDRGDFLATARNINTEISRSGEWRSNNENSGNSWLFLNWLMKGNNIVMDATRTLRKIKNTSEKTMNIRT